MREQKCKLKNNIIRTGATDKRKRYIILSIAIIFLLTACDSSEKGEKEKKEEVFEFTEAYNSQAKEIQRGIKKAGFDPGPIDGLFGWRTKKALKDFQKVNGLKATGLVDSKTWACLKSYIQEDASKAPGKESISEAVIKERLKSTAWPKKIQMALKNSGFNPGPIDGKIGIKTKRALRKFQESRGLSPDGIVDPKTWEKLSMYFPKE